jgi:hypothetical protein
MSADKRVTRRLAIPETRSLDSAQKCAQQHQPLIAQYCCKLLVRKGGFEPPRSCERQPLKLVRLPVPPLSRGGERRPKAAVISPRRAALQILLRLLAGARHGRG